MCDYISPGLMCNKKLCSDPDHVLGLQKAYEYVRETIFCVSLSCLPCFYGKPKYKIIPGWNNTCNILYNNAKLNFEV